MAPLVEVPTPFGLFMDWWMWAIYVLVGLGLIAFLASIIAPIFFTWYFKRKAIKYATSELKSLWHSVAEEDE